MLIPKIIHYCWFGGNPLPESAMRCIESWKKYCPDYKIVEWNESNFDVNYIRYTKEAYEAKKYAFVSDVARFEILYKHGGIYLDTDVELLKPIDDLLNMPFMGFEAPHNVNPGLIMTSYKGFEMYKEILDIYYNRGFSLDETVVTIITNYLLRFGLKLNNEFQVVNGLKIYPSDYFNPLGDNFGRLNITENTYSIHNYDASWKSKEQQNLQKYRKRFGRKLGKVIFIILHPIQSYNIVKGN